MASDEIDGVLTCYRITPTGSKKRVYSNHTRVLGPGGSPDGVIAATPDQLIDLPVLRGVNGDKIFNVNEKMHWTFKPTGAATTDASDATWAIPITYMDGSKDVLSGPSDANTWDVFVLGDVALIAGREYPVCELTVRQSFMLGGGKIFAVIENNA